MGSPFVGEVDGVKELFFFVGSLIGVIDFHLFGLIAHDAGVKAGFVVE